MRSSRSRVAPAVRHARIRQVPRWAVGIIAAALFACALIASPSGGVHAATLGWHTVVVDGQGKLLSWVTPQDKAYDQVMSLSWELLKHGMPLDPGNGLPIVYTYSEYDPSTQAGADWPNNPAGKNAMLADAARMYYAYSGDTTVVTLVLGLLRHQVLYGSTPPGAHWGGVPWSTGAAGSVTYGDDGEREGDGVLEPDKLGELGYHGYLWAYEVTGDTLYLNAALRCATELVDHLRTGSSTRSPWPYRVEAADNTVVEDYCADVIAPIRLFDELIRLGIGDVAAYQAARQAAWNWLMAYPMQTDDWVNYFEDVPVFSDLSNTNQYDPGQTARYLIEHPETDPDWLTHASDLREWIKSEFGGTDSGEPGIQFGAQTISEQQRYKYKMASHTGRYAAVTAMLAAATGDSALKDAAFRSLNWCTYMCRSDGVVIEGPAEAAHDSTCWFTDGHGDYVRHFLLSMAAFPEWAPAYENHLLRSSSVVRSIRYRPQDIAYVTFDSSATELLRMAYTPLGVYADDVPLAHRTDLAAEGWMFDDATGVLRVRHDQATRVRIVVDSSLGIGSGPPLGPLHVSPNPARAAAQVSFALPVASTVDVRVSDVTGRHVRTLLAGRLPAGSHAARWDGRDDRGAEVAAGVYLVSLRRGAEVRTTRLVRTR